MFISRLKALVSKPWLLPDKALAYLLVKLGQRVPLSTDSFSWLQAISTLEWTSGTVMPLWLSCFGSVNRLEILVHKHFFSSPRIFQLLR